MTIERIAGLGVLITALAVWFFLGAITSGVAVRLYDALAALGGKLVGGGL